MTTGQMERSETLHRTVGGYTSGDRQPRKSLILKATSVEPCVGSGSQGREWTDSSIGSSQLKEAETLRPHRAVLNRATPLGHYSSINTPHPSRAAGSFFGQSLPLCAHGGRSRTRRRHSNADIRPSVVAGPQMSVAGPKAAVRHRQRCVARNYQSAGRTTSSGMPATSHASRPPRYQ